MKGYIVVVNFLALLCQCSAKHVPDEVFPGYSGDGSGEETSTIVGRPSTTTLRILNDDNDLDGVIGTTATSHTDDDLYINTSQVNKDPDVDEKNNQPIDSGDISGNEEAIIVLVIVACLTFCAIAVFLIVIILRKRKSSQKRHVSSVYPNSRNFFITTSEKSSKSTEFLDVSGSTFEHIGQ